MRIVTYDYATPFSKAGTAAVITGSWLFLIAPLSPLP